MAEVAAANPENGGPWSPRPKAEARAIEPLPLPRRLLMAPLMMLMLSRFVFQAVSLVPLVLVLRRGFPTCRRVFGLICLRSLFHIAGIGMMFTSLRLLPLADAIAIVFVFPFILLFLGRFLLGETVGRDRIIACVLGFGGCLLVIKPSFAEVGLFALLPIAVAVAFSTFMLITRSW